MKKKGFTLIELLVVIAIIAMLMAILMPALGRVKRLASRLVCGTNLRGLGTACLIYSQENDEEFPVAGGPGVDVWAPENPDAYWDDEDFDWSGANNITISASQYLLVRNADVSPKVFICKSSGAKEFEGMDSQGNEPQDPQMEIVELYDFGDVPQDHVSYSYHQPYQPNTNFAAQPLSGMSSPGMAIMADKSPYWDSDLTFIAESDNVPDDEDPAQYGGLMSIPDTWDNLDKDAKTVANSPTHLREGQNVVYLDGHTEFEKRPDVGVENDNIYCMFAGPDNWEEDDKRQGAPSNDVNKTPPKSAEDNVLVNDGAPLN
jgi:prepilin-type N-terminal cleavage/methylation domain-containing protein